MKCFPTTMLCNRLIFHDVVRGTLHIHTRVFLVHEVF